jgi:H+/Cl- antiporter ClcA
MIMNQIKRLYSYAKSLLNRSYADSIRRNFLQALPFWVASIIAGFVAVVFTTLFDIVEDVFHAVKTRSTVLVLLITPLTFCAAFLVVHYFAPLAKGSGIPQVMASIELSNKKHSSIVDQLLGLKIILTKIFSSLLMVQGGAPIGREGPTIQISASIFRIIDKSIPSSWPKLSSQNYIITGAAAGLAAAFNTPLGGIVFAMEELAKIHVRYFRTALFTAVIIAGLTAQGILGPYLYLGYPAVDPRGISIFFVIGFVALVTGLAATFMCKFILWIRRQKRNFSFTYNIIFALVAGLVVAIVGSYLSESIFGSGKELMNGLLFSEEKSTSITTMLLRIAGPAISFNTGGAGGIFAPSLAAGASVGAYISGLFEYTGTSANILILCGMVSFLTGVTRTPFTSAILVLEMTDRHGVIFYLMFAALIAYLTSLIFDRHSLYDHLKKEYIIKGNNEMQDNRFKS